MSRAARDPRLTTPDTRSRLNTAAQQIISNAPSIRHELSEPSEARFDELDKKNSTIAALQRNFEGLSNMCKEERLKANEWKRQCEDQSKATDICKKKIADLEGKLRHLQDALDKGQGEKQGLLKVIEEQNKMKAELTAMKTSLQKKTQENIDKERALDQLRIELDKVNQCCAMLQSESGKLKTTINDAAMRYLNLENELNSSEIAKVELAAQLEKVGIDLNNALQTLSEYDSLSANSSKQLEMLKSELHASEEDRKEAAKRFFSLNSEYLAAVKEIQTLKEQILNEESSFKRKFESEINEKSALSDNLAKISKENRVFRAKIVEIEGEKHSLEVDIAEMRSILENKEKEGKEGVESIAQKLKIQSELVREYMKKIEITEKSLEKCKIQLSKSMAEREEAIKRENLIHSQLENSQNELKTALLESISLKSHSEILENKLKTELIAAERHFKTRETEYLESIRSKSQENKDLMGQLSAITASNQNLMGLLEAKNTENDEKDEKLRKFSEEIQHLTANISRLEAANSDMSEIHKLLNEISAQNSELESLRSSLSSAKQEICSLKLSSQSSDSLISRLHEVELSLSASEKESKLHARSVESLTSKLEVANSELTSTKAALNTLTIDFSQMRTANRQLDERLKSSEGSLRDARESIQRLQNQFESERSTTTALRGQTSELAERLHTAQTQIDAFQRTASRQEIMKSITEISHAIFAMESNLVCNACLEVMTDPVVCVPCGHNYCRTCKDGYEPACQQCGGTAAVKYTMKNQVVNEIASKVTFAKQVLEALPKDHRYYHQKDNYLNSSLFASSKMRQFYHEQLDRMQPVREQLAAEEQQTLLRNRSSQAEKTQDLRQQSQQRLKRRKLQRSLVRLIQLESLSKQKSMPDDMDGISPEALFLDTQPRHLAMKKDKNMWNMLDEIPAERLKKLLPKKEMQSDKGTVHLDAAEYLHSRLHTDISAFSKSRLDADDLRSQLVSRHQLVAQVRSSQLEAKAGIQKKRADAPPSRLATPFGRANAYNSSNVIAKLSKPKECTTPLDPYSRSEFRGMPYVDSLPGWRKIITGMEAPDPQSLLDGSLTVSNKIRAMRQKKKNQSFSEAQMTEWMQELDHFSRYHKKPVAPSASQAELGEAMKDTCKPLIRRPASNA